MNKCVVYTNKSTKNDMVMICFDYYLEQTLSINWSRIKLMACRNIIISHRPGFEEPSVRFWPATLRKDFHRNKTCQGWFSLQFIRFTTTRKGSTRTQFRSLTKYRNISEHRQFYFWWTNLSVKSCLSAHTSPNVMSIHRVNGLLGSRSVKIFLNTNQLYLVSKTCQLIEDILS